MNGKNGRPRRQLKRKDLTTYTSVSFTYRDEEFRAVLRDISETGAGFRLELSSEEPNLMLGEEVDFFIRTHYGEANVTGRIVWATHICAYLAWGIEFTRLTKEARELVMKLVDSGF